MSLTLKFNIYNSYIIFNVSGIASFIIKAPITKNSIPDSNFNI